MLVVRYIEILSMYIQTFTSHHSEATFAKIRAQRPSGVTTDPQSSNALEYR